MSAFVVSETHIDYMIRAALRLHYNHSPMSWIWNADRATGNYERETLPRGDHAAELRVGQMLWDTNRESVNYRYDDATEGPEYTGRPAASMQALEIESVQALKAIACYEYQSCEHDEWEGSEARAFCVALRRRAIDALPGYDDAAWDIPETRTHTVEQVGR